MIFYNQFLAFFVFACLKHYLLHLPPHYEADAFQPKLWICVGADPDSVSQTKTNQDPGHGKLNFLIETRFIWVHFHAPGSAFPIRIRIEDSQMNADSDPQQ